MKKTGIILLFLFLWTLPAQAKYFVQEHRKTIVLNDFIASYSAMDVNNNSYFVGYKGIDKVRRNPLLRAYDKTGKHLWSVFLYFNLPENIFPNIYDLRVIGKYIYILMAKTCISEMKYEGYISLEQIIVSTENGTPVTRYCLGEERLNNMLISARITSTGSSIISFWDENFFYVVRYDQGILKNFIISPSDEKIQFAIMDPKDENIYIFGTHGEFELFVRKYANNGLFLQEFFFYGENLRIEDVKFDEENFYIVAAPSYFTCIQKDNDLGCSPIWCRIYKLSHNLKFEYGQTIIGGDNNSSVYSIVMGLSQYDIYLGCLIVENLADFTHEESEVIIALNKIDGKEQERRETKCNSNFVNIRSINMYYDEFIFKGIKTRQAKMRVLIFGSDSKSKSYWIPQLKKIEINYRTGWNLISLPVIPLGYFPVSYFAEKIGAAVIYDYSTNGYVRVETGEISSDRLDGLKAGKAYWMYLTKSSSFEYTGMEVLAFDENTPRPWNMLGGCTYPFYYYLKHNKEIRPIIYIYNPNGGYLRIDAESLDPGFGYWAKFPDDQLPICAEVIDE